MRREEEAAGDDEQNEHDYSWAKHGGKLATGNGLGVFLYLVLACGTLFPVSCSLCLAACILRPTLIWTFQKHIYICKL